MNGEHVTLTAAKTGTVTDQPYDCTDVGHLWARAMYLDLGPGNAFVGTGGSTYQYHPADPGDA